MTPVEEKTVDALIANVKLTYELELLQALLDASKARYEAIKIT